MRISVLPVNISKPSGLRLKKSYILPIECIYVFVISVEH